MSSRYIEKNISLWKKQLKEASEKGFLFITRSEECSKDLIIFEDDVLILKKLLNDPKNYKRVYRGELFLAQKELAAILGFTNTKKGKRVLENEVFLLEKLNGQKGIIPTIKVLRSGGQYFILQPYYKENLRNAVALNIPLEEQYTVMHSLLVGLHAVHELKYVYRDFGPENILIENDHSGAVLTDLGACAPMQSIHENFSVKVISSFSPELVDSYQHGFDKQETEKTDMWGFGHLMFLMHYGKMPPWFHSLNEKKSQNIFNIIRDPSLLPEPNKKDAMPHLIWRMLRPDPEERVDVKEALSILDQFIPSN